MHAVKRVSYLNIKKTIAMRKNQGILTIENPDGTQREISLTDALLLNLEDRKIVKFCRTEEDTYVIQIENNTNGIIHKMHLEKESLIAMLSAIQIAIHNEGGDLGKEVLDFLENADYTCESSFGVPDEVEQSNNEG